MAQNLNQFLWPPAQRSLLIKVLVQQGLTCRACVLPTWQLPVSCPRMWVHCRLENVTMNEKERDSIPEIPTDQWEINLPKCNLDAALLKHKSGLTRQGVTASLHVFSHSTNS